jgi:hypothetical protein
MSLKLVTSIGLALAMAFRSGGIRRRSCRLGTPTAREGSPGNGSFLGPAMDPALAGERLNGNVQATRGNRTVIGDIDGQCNRAIVSPVLRLFDDDALFEFLQLFGVG